MLLSTQPLNPQQLQAVRHGEGPLMVVAGAGSGKTRVITCRIVSLIQDQNIIPEAILAITFTNKAAGEMLERVRSMLGSSDAVWISTFHAFCLKVLRRHAERLGFHKDFIIYDRQDQISLIKRCMKDLKVHDDVFAPKAILHHISGFKNDFLFPEDINLDAFGYDVKLKAGEVYPHYQKSLTANNAMDFDDLLVQTVKLLQKEPEVADYYNKRFRHVLVDEFQDTNAAQYKLVRLLTGLHKNICVVGDDDQSIYRWRGANIENILNFEKDYPRVAVIKLEENYRSTQTILKAAGAIVAENVRRKGKTLWTNNEAGEPIQYIRAEDETDEAETVCDHGARIHREEGISLNEIAVLYRTNAQSRSVEDILRRHQVPYQVVGGLRFYERKEIKDVLAYLRVAVNPEDAVSLRRIVNLPVRGIGKISLEKLETYSRKNNITLFETMRQAGSGKIIGSGPANKIASFVALIEDLRTIYQTRSAHEFLGEVLNRSGYMSMLEKDPSLEIKGRIENIRELYTAVEQFTEKAQNNSLQDFLDTTTLASDADQYDNTQGILHLMTLHTSKGHEFKVVFIVGMENRLLPHVNSMAAPEEYEEERRLCYVGFTRAKQYLFLTNAKRRRVFGSVSYNNPSEFLDSIPKDLLAITASLGNPSGEADSSSQEEWGETPCSRVPSQRTPYAIGTKVIHPKFGSGVIIRREGDEDDLKVIIFFKQAGKKTLAVNHAKLIIL